VVAGALVAGAATLLSGNAGEPAADQGRLGLAATDTRRGGDLEQRGTPTKKTPDTTTTTIPPTTTTQPPPPTTTTPPQTTEAPPPATTKPDSSAQDQVVALTNAERQQAGCGPLTVDADITAAAQGHATDMANRDYFEHTTPEGVTFDQRIRNAGYSRPGAENIAKGASSAAQVMDLWMNSAGHRANILNCDLNTIGVALDRDGFYWVQDFGF
jgi:uncharacterized protein YkwD